MGHTRPENYKNLGALAKTIKYSLMYIMDEAKRPVDSSNPSDRKDYLDDIGKRLTGFQKKINDFDAWLRGDRQPKIGVFGCPSMGKSSLFNVLLGVEMLPMFGAPGTTRFGTEIIRRKYESEDKPYKIMKILFKGTPEISYCWEDYNDACTILEEFSKEADLNNPQTAKIVIEGPFDSFIDDDLVFVDTPGIEFGARKEDMELLSISHDWVADRQRALDVLDNVDIVIFCIRLDYPEFKDVVPLYNELIKKYDPINVITVSDKRKELKDPELETNEGIISYIRRQLRIMNADTVVVSSKKALEIIRAAKKNGKKIKKIFDREFTGVDLEGFKELKTMILKKLGVKDSSFTENRIKRFLEEYDDIRKDAERFNIILPNKKYKSKKKASGEVWKVKGVLSSFIGKFFKVLLWIIIITVILAVIIIALLYVLN